jgi:hypothetical protein
MRIMTAPDIKTLIGEVAARHGVTLRADDPAFVLVTVNQLVLEQAIAELAQRAQEMMREFDRSAERVQAQAGSALARGVQKASAEIREGLRHEIAEAITTIHSPGQSVPLVPNTIDYRWLSVGAIAGSLLMLIGILIGHVTALGG